MNDTIDSELHSAVATAVWDSLAFPKLLLSVATLPAEAPSLDRDDAGRRRRFPLLPAGEYLVVARGGYIQRVSWAEEWRPNPDVVGFHIYDDEDTLLRQEALPALAARRIDLAVSARLGALLTHPDRPASDADPTIHAAFTGLETKAYTEEDNWVDHFVGRIDIVLALRLGGPGETPPVDPTPAQFPREDAV